MAIPQPRAQFNGPTKAQYQQQQLRDLGQSIQNFTSLGLQKQRQNEQKRQFNYLEGAKNAYSILQNQYGGDWARFATDNSKMMQNLFTSTYGEEEGNAVFEQFMRNPQQTGEQKMREAFEYGLEQDGAPGPASEPGSMRVDAMTGFQRTPAKDSEPEPQRQQQQYVTHEDYQPQMREPAQSSVQGGGMTGPVAGATGDQRTVAYLQQADQMAKQGAYLPNGLRKSEGVEDTVPVPLNTESMSTVFGGLEIPADASDRQIATALSEAVKQYDPEAGVFFGRKTSHLATASEEQRAEFDQMAQEKFGMDGDTLLAVRNQMFDNVRKGRPIDYMPPEEERTQWWWTGENIPVAAKVRDLTTVEEPTIETVNAAVSNGELDVDSLEPGEVKEVMKGLDIGETIALEQALMDPKYLNSVARNMKLPETFVDGMKSAIEMVNNEQRVRTIGELKLEDPKRARVVERFYNRASDAFKSGLNRFKKRPKDLEKVAEREKQRREEGRPNDSLEQVIADSIAMRKARSERLYEKIKNGEISPAMYALMPADIIEKDIARRDMGLQERRFEEAERQFDAQQRNVAANRRLEERRVQLAERGMDLEEDKFALTAGSMSPEDNAKMQAAQLANLEARTALLKKQVEAFGQGSPEDQMKSLALIEEVFSKTIKQREDAWMKAADGDPEKFRRLKIEGLKTDPAYRDAINTVSEVYSQITGIPSKEITLEADFSWYEKLRQKVGTQMQGQTPKGGISYYGLGISPTVSSEDTNSPSEKDAQRASAAKAETEANAWVTNVLP